VTLKRSNLGLRQNWDCTSVRKNRGVFWRTVKGVVLDSLSGVLEGFEGGGKSKWLGGISGSRRLKNQLVALPVRNRVRIYKDRRLGKLAKGEETCERCENPKLTVLRLLGATKVGRDTTKRGW